jgi:hypothetical protein
MYSCVFLCTSNLSDCCDRRNQERFLRVGGRYHHGWRLCYYLPRDYSEIRFHMHGADTHL